MTAVAARPAAAPDVLLKALDEGILRLTLNRPGKRNTLSEAMLAALGSAIEDASAERAVRVVVVAANGPGFSGGHDLQEMTERRRDPDSGAAYFQWLMGRCSSVMQAVVNCPKPVIAEVHGIATAAGCQLVASCDLAVASEDAKFGTSGINVGLFCSTPMVALSRSVTPKAAIEMLLTGDMIDAREALRIGLVNRVVPRARLERETTELARKIAAKPSAVVKLGKQAFYAQAGLPLAEAYAHCSRVMVENLLMPDAEEGIGAFLGKRTPKWPD